MNQPFKIMHLIALHPTQQTFVYITFKLNHNMTQYRLTTLTDLYDPFSSLLTPSERRGINYRISSVTQLSMYPSSTLKSAAVSFSKRENAPTSLRLLFLLYMNQTAPRLKVVPRSTTAQIMSISSVWDNPAGLSGWCGAEISTRGRVRQWEAN